MPPYCETHDTHHTPRQCKIDRLREEDMLNDAALTFYHGGSARLQIDTGNTRQLRAAHSLKRRGLVDLVVESKGTYITYLPKANEIIADGPLTTSKYVLPPRDELTEYLIRMVPQMAPVTRRNVAEEWADDFLK